MGAIHCITMTQSSSAPE